MTIPNGMFSKKDLDVNSPLPKVDKISFIAKHPKASLIGITKSKLDSSILSSEVDIVGYDSLEWIAEGREMELPVILKKVIIL